MRRFVLHVLPTGFKRIRHYGVLASSCKAAKLAQARAALAMPASKALALESAAAFVKRTAGIDAQQCPCCSAGTAACGADAGRAKATAHGQQHGAAAGTRPAMRGHARIGGSAFTARSGGPGWGAGAASAKRLAAHANRSAQGLYAQKIARPPVPAQLWLANGAGTSP